MKRQKIEEKITSYLLGDLSPEEAVEIRGLLEVSPGSRALAQELEQTLDLVRGALAADFPVPEELSTERKAKIRETAKPAPLIWFDRNHKMLAQVAAVVVLIGSLAVVSKVFRAQDSNLGLGLSPSRAANQNVASSTRYGEIEESIRSGMDSYDDRTEPAAGNSKGPDDVDSFVLVGGRLDSASYQLQELEKDLIDARVDMLVTKNRLGKVEAMDEKEIHNAMDYVGRDSQLTATKSKLVDLELSAELAKQKLGDDHPDVQRLESQSEMLRRDLREQGAWLRTGLRADYDVAKARVQRLESQSEELRGDLREQGERLRAGVRADYDVAEARDEELGQVPERLAGDDGSEKNYDLNADVNDMFAGNGTLGTLPMENADVDGDRLPDGWGSATRREEVYARRQVEGDDDREDVALKYEHLLVAESPDTSSGQFANTRLAAGATVGDRLQEWELFVQDAAAPVEQASKPPRPTVEEASPAAVTKSPPRMGGRPADPAVTDLKHPRREREEEAQDSSLEVPALGDIPVLGRLFHTEGGAESRRSNVHQEMDWDAIPDGVADCGTATESDDDSSLEGSMTKSSNSYDVFLTGEVRGQNTFSDKAEAEDLPAIEVAARPAPTEPGKSKRKGPGSFVHGIHYPASAAPLPTEMTEPIGGIAGYEKSAESSEQKNVLSQNAVGYVKNPVAEEESFSKGLRFLRNFDEYGMNGGMDGLSSAKERESDKISGVQPEAVIGDLALAPDSKHETREGSKEEPEAWSNPDEIVNPGSGFFLDRRNAGSDVKPHARPTRWLEPDAGPAVDKMSENRDISSLYRSVNRSVAPEVVTEPDAPPVFKPAAFNPYIETAIKPLSTFSIDVDTAAYTLTRKYMNSGSLPPPEAVRTEEFVNFFDYDYSAPKRQTFEVYTTVARTPFTDGELLKIGVKGRRLGREEERPAVLTFVIDSSGSMDTPDRLGLVKSSLKKLVSSLSPRDRVAVVQVDSRARLVLPHVAATDTNRILGILNAIQCSGSTHLEEGITFGYQVARKGFQAGSENRVLILSDGVANLGADSAEQILNRVEESRRQGITCSVFGFGIGTYNDVMLEELANKGDGVYRFIDSEDEAHRVFVDELAGAMQFIAKDVKIQVDFDPGRVRQYRQVGYENRALKDEDFRNDTVDAGEVGSGQSVTALYEILPGDSADKPIGVVRVRYRNYSTGEIDEIAHPILQSDVVGSFEETDSRFRLAVAVAEFSEILRGSPYSADSTFSDVADVLRPVAMDLRLDQRVQELTQLVQLAGGLPRAGP